MTDSALGARIDAARDAHGDLPPPWAKYPEIPAGHLAWRMGAGEDWLCLWSAWLAREPRDRASRLAYLRRHPPAPRTWRDEAVAVIEPELAFDLDADPDRLAALAAELEAAGVIGDDVAFAAWAASHPDGPPPPWRAASPADALRYGARELTFFVRWAIPRRDELTAWAEAPHAWAPFREALMTGRAPGAMPRDGREAVALLLAAHGEPPPPWARGESPATRTHEHGDVVSYADAWCAWVVCALDDTASLHATLSRAVPAPADWAPVVAELEACFAPAPSDD